jgi:hypothetical protein
MLRRSFLTPVLGAACGFAAVAASVLGLAVFVAPQPAGALASYTQQTGLSCGRCHTNPAGGGALTGFGSAFAANGHKVPSGTKSDKKEAATAPAPEVTSGPAIVLDYAQAQALSLQYPYYSHFNYSPCDYSNCSK